ncbi:hypothetical protein KAFR_0B01760 [Kazachstania africana CBS 2517]|uniref:Uncharacterized protein n=1 Tax=Kazachstania africana (strain ATCC 22294 / BCRC 22015 / CBS 2517 / CECT 1963 / NBRC 1671 / NRRL Y-8276) TaxID=1071382 RepID=H2AQ25_KAZAF|nr:hypothetical protein KAFR_0B01760 [Kazachstania africana CBS 2517]CCF56475.1 hypothetical protein KAFR_0B01760 [Kazachstania africana CBS 2517]
MDSDQVAHLLELEDKLSNIRAQINSKLDNQKHIAIILSAVEENIKDHATNDTSKNLVNYLVSFMSLLDQAMDSTTHEIKDLQLATSATYLLDIIFHYCPKKLLRAQFAEVLTKIAPCITDEKAEAPIIRSGVGCLEALLIAQDTQAWNNTHDLTITPKRGLQGLLELSLDHRPKIRKRACEAISNILLNPPVAPTPEHVASSLISDFAIKYLSNVLNEFSTLSNKKLKNQTIKDEYNGKIIRCLKLINTIVSTKQWPTSQIEKLCDLLLEITKSTEQFLVSSSFECFESLFKSMGESTGLAEDKFLKVLNTIFQLKPSSSDIHLAGSWIAVVVKGVTTYSLHEPFKCVAKLPDIFKIMSHYLQSETMEISFSASQGLIAILSSSVNDNVLLSPPQVTEDQYNLVNDVITELSDIFSDFLSIRYSHCSKEILNILTVAFNKLKSRSNPALLKPLRIVDKWRINEENYLELRGEVETVIGAAIEFMGPEIVLQVLPLNLDNFGNDTSRPGRAWLLPILRDHIKHAKLATFIGQFIPLIKLYESKYEKLPSDSVQLRIFQTVVDQIWSTLPHFCDVPTDLKESFTDEFASDLCSLLYSNVELRSTIINALKNLVESNLSYAESDNADLLPMETFPREESLKNIEYLSTTKVMNVLAVLFNVYTQTPANSRGYILETIESYLKITKEEDMTKTFNNVCALLKTSMDEKQANLTSTLLDIIIVMVKYLSTSAYGTLFNIFGQTINSTDTAVQKRSYKIISRLSETSDEAKMMISSHITDIENIILSNSESVQTSARSGRLVAIKTVVDLLPNDHLGFIARIVAEIILATKDVNERTRDTAFETLLSMGKRMQQGGIIKLGDQDVQENNANIAEFFKIISVGLIGESQHMVSSTVTAYACLMFEFKDLLSEDVIMEIYDTIELYLTSNSREIAKSAIGFTKVCVLGLPEPLMKPKVPELIPKLLRWSHEHTGHFKAKVKHILERLIRRFGYEYIEANFPEDDMRLLANIRKTRNRNKRRGEGNEEINPMASDKSSKASKFMSAFDEAVYDSADENSGSDDESSGGQRKREQFIVEKTGENPLDLLDSQTLAHISSTRPKKFNKKDQKRRLQSDDSFAFDAEGKLIVKGQKGKASVEDDDPLKEVTSGINAYLEAVQNGPTRGQRNKLRFKKKNNGGDDGFSDNEDNTLPKSKPMTKNKIGKNFKKSNQKFKSRRRL